MHRSRMLLLGKSASGPSRRGRGAVSCRARGGSDLVRKDEQQLTCEKRRGCVKNRDEDREKDESGVKAVVGGFARGRHLGRSWPARAGDGQETDKECVVSAMQLWQDVRTGEHYRVDYGKTSAYCPVGRPARSLSRKGCIRALFKRLRTHALCTHLSCLLESCRVVLCRAQSLLGKREIWRDKLLCWYARPEIVQVRGCGRWGGRGGARRVCRGEAAYRRGRGRARHRCHRLCSRVPQVLCVARRASRVPVRGQGHERDDCGRQW